MYEGVILGEVVLGWREVVIKKVGFHNLLEFEDFITVSIYSFVVS